jgi:undecaprenyl-diphosphatase
LQSCSDIFVVINHDTSLGVLLYLTIYASVVELVDATDSKSVALRGVPVQVGSEVPLDLMNFIIIFKSIFLGIVEALTEFLPVSSTAHLIIFSKIINFDQIIKNNIFEISVQTGAIFAIFLFYHKKIINLGLNYHKDHNSRNFVNKIVIAIIPAFVAGFILHDFIKNVLFSPIIIATSLIVGGVIMIMIENKKIKPEFSLQSISYKKSFLVGLCQALAIIPGVSRSGATIMGGIFLKIDRKDIVEFSFFLAIPVIIGATVFDLWQNHHLLNMENIQIILIGILSSFLASLLVIRFLLYFVSNFSFKIFGYYRILFGAIILAFLY